ncbi:MAG: UDP-N-acetylmuramoyl-L-alanine--D-glutamate ligase [Clostridiales bacterium]|jgi:UDP-N-acetylmuramoylalanine--D-glutamate ligase|nr:UDP-N-acetylmuramoyl-L-alanine--D-glutamate ligase [Clostridiales bacterium]
MSKNVLIIGFGRSGRSAAKLVNETGDNVYIYDEKAVADIPCFVRENRSGYETEKLFDGIDSVIISPSAAINSALVKQAESRGIAVVGETETAYAAFGGGVTAVTGTNGKTTVTMLIHGIFEKAGIRCAALGNIGTPFSEFFWLGIDEAVLEVSSFQLESIKTFRPHIAVFLNFAPDHLDRHADIKEYFAAKLNLFLNQTRNDFAVINADDPYLREKFGNGMPQGYESELFYFSAERRVKGVYVKDGDIIFDDGRTAKKICTVSDIPLKGRHNLENALAAICAAYLKNIGSDDIEAALKSFEPPRHRIEFVRRIGGTDFFDDSKGTNVHATVAAVKSMVGETVLILGGSDKGENFGDLFKDMPKSVKEIFVTGQNSHKILAAASGFEAIKISETATLEECVKQAYAAAPDNVLFSPASASFDRYRSYEERGKHFVRITEELI